MSRTQAVLTATLFAVAAQAQETVPQPAQSAQEASRPEREGEPRRQRLKSFEQPALETVVRDKRFREEEPIGDYGQPRWTARRRFPTTRIYVVPRGQLQVEYWLESKLALTEPEDVRFRSQLEMEIGLGHRLQLDLYLTTQQKGVDGPFQLHREKIELRYALADWGVIPANPTVYVELVREHDGPPKAELKLLLGGEVRSGLHWGSNLVFERQLGGPVQEHEYVVTGALAWTGRDMELSLGAELKVAALDVRGRRFDFDELALTAGPSLQWRPVPEMHVDLVSLFGPELAPSNRSANVALLSETLLVVGWEL